MGTTVGRVLRVGLLMEQRLTREMLLDHLSASRTLLPVVLDVAETEPDAEVDVLIVARDQLGLASSRWPDVPFISLQPSEDPQDAAEALHEGASAVLDTTSSLQDVQDAVLAVSRSQTWLPPTQVTAVLAALTASRPVAERHAVESLTQREREVLVLMGQGLTRREIAERLVVSPHTARTHVQNVLLKLGVHSQVAVAAVARRAAQAGWLDPGEAGPGRP